MSHDYTQLYCPVQWKTLTLDELANADGDDELSTLAGGVEPCEMMVRELLELADWSATGWLVCCSLVTLVVRLGGILDPSSVLHGNGISLGDLSAAALLNQSLVDTHDVGFYLKLLDELCLRFLVFEWQKMEVFGARWG